jgi:hypothetical protein
MGKTEELLKDIDADYVSYTDLTAAFQRLTGELFRSFIGFSSASDAWDDRYRLANMAAIRSSNTSSDDESDSDDDDYDYWYDIDIDDYKNGLAAEVKQNLPSQLAELAQEVENSPGLARFYSLVGEKYEFKSTKELWDSLKDNNTFWELAFSEFKRYNG